MNLSQLVEVLDQKSIQLSAKDGKLNFKAPPGALDDELKSELRIHKQALLEIHSSQPEPSSYAERTQNHAPASMAQQGLWFTEQLDVPANVYAVHLAWRCHGTLDTHRLQVALNHLVTIHESLRTTLSVDDSDALIQTVNPPQPVPLSVQAREYNDIDWRRAALQLLQEPFSLSTQQLLRAAVFEINNDEYIILLTTHHSAVDGWSVNILTQDLQYLYEFGELAKVESNTPNHQYLEYANWQNTVFQSTQFTKQLAYWRNTLSGTLPVINLPTDHIRPAIRTFQGNSIRTPIESALIDNLTAQARQSGTTLYTLLFGAFCIFLYRYTRDEEMIIGTPVSNRGHTAFNKTVGLFANTLAIRTKVDPHSTLTDYLTLFKNTIADAISAQDVPFETLVKELAPERDRSRNPLYQVMFTLQNLSAESLKLPGLEAESVSNLNSLDAKFDLALEINVHSTSSELHFNYSCDLFDERSIQTLSNLFKGMLEELSEYTDTPISQIPLLSESDRNNQLALGRGIVTEHEEAKVIDLFAKQVSKTPDKTALIYKNEALCYQDVAKLVESIASKLRDAGCAQGDIVALCLPRSVEYIASALAVLQCEAIWCPLSPALPKNRMDLLLADSNARFIVVPIEASESNTSVEVNAVANTSEPVNPQFGPEAAYLFYTSGSSGTPKGVIGTQRGLVNRLQWMWSLYPFDEDDTACIKTSTGFIDSLWESFGSLLAGVPSVIVPESDNFDLPLFLELVDTHKISRLVVVPSLLTAILEQMKTSNLTWPALRLCISSGEALNGELSALFYSVFPNATLLNLYGLSEVTADATYYEVPKDFNGQNTPLGRSIGNSMTYVLDNNRALVPKGMLGDIYIAGAGLAKGYHQQSALTNEVFVQDPFHGGLMFKTGDRGYWNENGFLEYGGRLDKQCKILGIRIDCGEIESTLLQLDNVNRARVFPKDCSGVDKLMAHVELCTSKSTDVEMIRKHLKAHLPTYLIPSDIVLHDNFPQLPNGKIDQLALKDTDNKPIQTDRESLTQTTPEQRKMLATWGKILKSQVTSVDDDFFNLGGHSLLAVTLLNAINDQFASNLSVSTFFNAPTPQGCLLAMAESATSNDSESALTVLKKGDGNQRIFMMPPSSYTSAYFQQLKVYLPDECGLLSIDSSMALQHDSIESLCTEITSEILKIQPEGPWFVGGACFGNHWALEISRQLKSLTNGEVTLLLIDSRPPLSGPTWTFQSSGQTAKESRLGFLARILLQEYKRDKFRSFTAQRIRRIRGKLNPVIGQFIKVGYWQDKQFIKYKGSVGSANIVLMQSKEFQTDIESHERWQQLSSKPVRHAPIAARYHSDLTFNKSKHWKQVADEMMDICFQNNKES